MDGAESAAQVTSQLRRSVFALRSAFDTGVPVKICPETLHAAPKRALTSDYISHSACELFDLPGDFIPPLDSSIAASAFPNVVNED